MDTGRIVYRVGMDTGRIYMEKGRIQEGLYIE